MRSIKDVMTSFVAMSIISVAACTEDHTVVNPSVPQVHSRNLVNTRSGQYSFRDSLWFSYVDDVPGFGGMYFDDGGDLIVFLTDTSAESRLRATKTLVGYVGQSHRPNTLPASGHPATMRFRHARDGSLANSFSASFLEKTSSEMKT